MTHPAPGATPGLFRVAQAAVGLGACVLPLFWVVDPGRLVRGNFVLDQFTSLELGLALCFVLLGKARVTSGAAGRWLNALLAAASLGLGVWLFILFNAETMLILRPTPPLLTVSVLALGLCLYAGWTAAGRDTVVLIGTFLAFGYLAQFLPSWIGSPPVRLESYIVYMTFGSNGILGMALQIISVSVVVFLLFGIGFELSGGTRAIGAIALLVARIGRGAAISVSIVASGLFGTISGSATSNVLTSGSFSIPGMKRMGVAPAAAGGIEAAASTLGQVTPPVMGAAAFLMANATGIPYAQIAMAAAVPALLCYGALFLQGEALGRRIGARDGGLTYTADDARLGWGDLLHLVPVAGLVASLLLAPARPELAGVVGAALAVAVALVLKGPRRTWQDARTLFPKATKAVSGLVVTASTVGIILAVIASTGLDVQLTILISQVGNESLFLSLLLASVTAFVLGLGVGTAGVYIVAGTLLAPGLVQLGVPVLAAHLFVLYSAMLSMITPPVAFASLTAAGIAGAGFYATSNAAMRFGWALFVVPFLFVYSPELVLVGDAWSITVVLAATLAGVLLVSMFVFDGWRGRSPLAWLGFGVGLCLMLPVLPQAMRLGGAVAGLLWLVARAVLARRNRRLAVSS